MAQLTIAIKGRGIYKIGEETVNLKENTLQNVTSDITDSSDSYEYDNAKPELVSLLDIAYNEKPDVPVPIYASDNSVKDEIEGSNSIVDLIVNKAEDDIYKDTKNIKYVTLRGTQAGSAARMFKGSKVQYVRFAGSNHLTDAREMFANCELLEDVISPSFLQANNCDYIFSYDRHFAKSLGDDGVVKMLMSIGVKNDWHDGLNRTYFWDCPYNGTLPEFLASKITSEDLYTYQKSLGFNPNDLIPKVLNAINLDDKLDTYNYTINKDASIKSNINFFDSSASNLIKLHFDNTEFKTEYSTLVYAAGPNRPADPDPEITITDNYDDKVKGIQNLLYNIKDIWDFAAFKNTVDKELELTTSVILNAQHNGPKLNDIISPIWDPDDNFRLNIINLDVTAYVKKPVDIAERYWIPHHHQETFWRKTIAKESYVGPVFAATYHDENWNSYDLGHNLGQGKSVKWITSTYYDTRDKYNWNPPTDRTYGYWTLSPVAKESIPIQLTYPDRSYITNGLTNSGYGQPVSTYYAEGGPKGGPSTPGANPNNPPKTGNRPQMTTYTYNKDIAESYIDWVADWSGDANHPDHTRTIQVPFNVYLNDSDCPPQDISDAFKDVPYIKSINFNRNKISKADNLFMNCKNLESAVGSITNGDEPVESAKHIFDGAFIEDPHFDFIVDTSDAESAFENSGIVDPSFFKNWHSVLNGNKVFKNSKVKHIKEAIFPERIQTIAEAFADCENLVDVEGNWLQPNSSMHYQNYTFHSGSGRIKDWVNPVTKDGYFYFPDSVQDIHSLFKDSGLQSVKDLKLLLNGNNDNVFFDCKELTDVDNLYLNENPNYANIFWDTFKQNNNWRIWFPTNIKSNYPAAIDIGLDPYKVSNLYCDDGFIVVDDESPDVQVLRRSAYEHILNPEKRFKFNYFSHIHPHTIDNNRFFHEMHDVDVWYK